MSSLHQYTPSLTAIDPRGLTVRTVAYHRRRVQDVPEARISRQVYGANGMLQQQWDPRLYVLHVSDSSVQANQRHCHSLSGHVLRSDSVDAGWQITLLGGAGQLVRHWTGRGTERTEYDSLLRPVAVFEQAADEFGERCIERLTYAPMSPEQAARNRCGRLIRHDDPAGSVFYEDYALSGAVGSQTRRFIEARTPVDWRRDIQLEPEGYRTTWRYDALGALLEQVDAKGNRQQSQYGVEGELSQVALMFSSGKRKVLLDQRVYNAAGQVQSERAGNGVFTVADYAEEDGSLRWMASYRLGQHKTPLQELAYTYDRVGNVLSISDAAQPTAWARNSKVDAFSAFEYDSLYQLTKATGREHSQHRSGPGLPGLITFGSGQDNLWRYYTRHYHYDAGANLLQMQHVPATGSGFTQRMRVAAHSNHSVLEASSSPAGQGSGFDPCGNQQTLAPGQAMSWNLRNQLTQVTQVQRENDVPDEEIYVYDAGGQRVLKCRTSKAKGLTHRHEVRYLPGLELRRNHATGEWLNVLAVGAGRAQVRGLKWEQGQPSGVADEQLRFSLSDLAGSSTLELDEQAALLSQEGYYPYGATAWWAAKNVVEATFKTVRYSGKERDATGLYYYGHRYYAPWLQRWVSADPAGDADGLNVYAMVGNNPVTRVDSNGLAGVPLSHYVLVGLVFAVLIAVGGLAVGWLLDATAQGAIAGGIIGLGAWATIANQGYWAGRRRALARSPEARESRLAAWLSREAIRLAANRGLTHDETHRLVNFFYERGREFQGELSIAAHTTAEGKIYGFVGPKQSAKVANQLVGKAQGPLGREFRQLGYRNILLRDPTYAQSAGPSTQAGESQFAVQATTQLAKRKLTKSGSPVASSQAPASVTQGAGDLFDVDTSAVEHLMHSDEGRSIALTIGHVREGRFAAVRWHRHEAGLWSADLHGYPGGGAGRGAYRLMFEHLGARRYRIAGVRDPH